MNRGSALKWVKQLESGKYKISDGILRSELNGENFFCPWGVLCDFIDPHGWHPHSVHMWTFHGEVFYPPEFVLKKCKIRSKYSLERLEPNFDSANMVLVTCAWIKSFYHVI